MNLNDYIIKKFKTAFTLVELLVVIAIVGILSGLIIVGMSSSVRSASIAKAQIFSSSLRDSLLADLVSEWKFDQINGSITPDSWSSNNCTLSGTTLPQLQTSNCVYGNCLSFDGATGYLDCGSGSNLNIMQNFTISFWINPLTYSFTDSAAFICGNGTSNTYGYHVWLYKTGYAAYRTNQSGTYQQTTSYSNYIDQNKWTNIVITRSGSNATIYINAIDRTNAHASHIDSTTSPLNTFIGRYTSGAYFLNGWLDEMRIFDNVIPSSKIEEQYYSGLNKLLANDNLSKIDYKDDIKRLHNEEI